MKDEYAWLWFRPEEGKPLLLRERHRPCFLAEMKDRVAVELLRGILETHPLIYSVSEVRIFTDLRRVEKKIFAEIRVDLVDSLKEVIEYTDLHLIEKTEQEIRLKLGYNFWGPHHER